MDTSSYPGHVGSGISGNLEDFFQHENQAFPPSLSRAGYMNKGVKADLVGCLEDFENSIVGM